MLTDLTPGQTAAVLQLPASSRQPAEKRAAAEAPREAVEPLRETAPAPAI